MDIAVLLVHGDPSVMRGVRMRLEVEPGFRLLPAARRSDDLDRVARETDADVVVLDADANGRDALELAAIRALSARGPVVVLTLADSEAAAEAALEAGAASVVRKQAPSALLAAIRLAASAAGGGGRMA